MFSLWSMLGFGCVFFFGSVRRILRRRVSRARVLIGSAIGPMCIIACFSGVKVRFSSEISPLGVGLVSGDMSF